MHIFCICIFWRFVLFWFAGRILCFHTLRVPACMKIFHPKTVFLHSNTLFYSQISCAYERFSWSSVFFHPLAKLLVLLIFTVHFRIVVKEAHCLSLKTRNLALKWKSAWLKIVIYPLYIYIIGQLSTLVLFNRTKSKHWPLLPILTY